MRKTGIWILTALLTLTFCAGAFGDGAVFRSYDEALKYARENKPAELDVGEVRWQPERFFISGPGWEK